jgi:hypothetical protein
MAKTFKDFMAEFFGAVKKNDFDFINRTYSDWLETSGEVPPEQKGMFANMIISDLQWLAGLNIDEYEEFGDYGVAHMKTEDGEISITFRKKGDSWAFFNEKMDFTKFKKVYAIGYQVEGGSLRVLFNGKRTPIADKIQNSGFNSIINSALKVGENEMVLEPLEGAELKVSLRISSAKEGEIISTDEGNVLKWEGTVKEPVALKFKAE